MIQTLQEYLSQCYHKTIETQAQNYNRKHLSQKYKIRDEIKVISKNIKIKHFCKKLNDKYYELFQVIESVDTQAYQVKLPPRWRIHSVFHVLLLKPYH